MLKTLLGLAVAVATSAGTAQAATVLLSSIDGGNYRHTGAHNTNSITAGYIPGSTFGTYRSYFLFDLTSLAGTVESIQSVSLTFAPGYGVNSGNDTSKGLVVNGYEGNITSLLAGTAGVTAFDDLGNGAYSNTSVGKPSSTANPAMPEIAIPLNIAGRNGILAATSATASDNRFVIGAALTETYTTSNTLWSGAWPLEGAASLSINYTPTTPVPEPAALALFASGLAGLGFVARRRRKVTKEN